MTASSTGILTTTDPFTLVEDALWFALDSSPHVTAVVKVGNTVRPSRPQNPPEKSALNTADVPELSSGPVSVASNQNNSSSGPGMVYRLAFGIQTDDLRTAGDGKTRPGMNQVVWAVLRALRRYAAGIPDLPFAKSVMAREAPERIGQIDPDRAERVGWTALVNVEVSMVFANDEMNT